MILELAVLALATVTQGKTVANAKTANVQYPTLSFDRLLVSNIVSQPVGLARQVASVEKAAALPDSCGFFF